MFAIESRLEACRLKLIYKTLLNSLLCTSLLFFDLSTNDILNFNTASAAQTETLKTEGISDPDLMGTLTMTIVGTLAMRLYTYKKTLDIWLAAGGGAIFIAGEVLAFSELKKAMNDIETKITRDDKGNIDQKQIEALLNLRESYEEAKSTANNKKNLQTAAAAAFVGAGLSAYTMTMSEVTGLSTCTSAISTSLSALNSRKATCTQLATQSWTQTLASRCFLQVGNCEGSILSFQPQLHSHEMKRQALMPSLAALTSDTTENQTLSTLASGMTASCIGEFVVEASGVGPVCTPLFAVEATNSSGGGMPRNVSSNNFSTQRNAYVPKNNFNMKKYFENAMNILFPSANAELFSTMGIASSAAITFLMYTNKAIGPMIDTYMLTPKNRALVWVILAGSTYAASKSTDNQISKIEANIQKIDVLINSMHAYQNGVAQDKGPSIKNPTINTAIQDNRKLKLNDGKYEDVDFKVGAAKALPCVNGQEASRCPEYSSQLKNLQDFKTMPTELQTTMSSVVSIVDGVNGKSKISGSTLGAAGALNGQLSAIQAKLVKSTNEVQSKLKALNGSDLSKESSKFENDLKNAIQNSLKNSKMSAGEMLASFSSGRSGEGSSQSVATDAKTQGKDDKNSKIAASGVNGPANVAIPAAAIPKLENLDEKDPVSSTDKQNSEKLATSPDPKAAAQSIDDYELKNDISNNKDVSIFDLISNRYQKSGYPRLFKQIK